MNDDIRQKKLEINFAFFKNMKQTLKNDAQSVVSGALRRWYDKLPEEKKMNKNELKPRMKNAIAGIAKKGMKGLLG